MVSPPTTTVLPARPAEVPAPSFEQERALIHQKMLSSVSHDLKTPLASIIGSLEIYERMRDKLTDQKKQDLIDVALQEAYRLDTFITNILDMAKLENGMVKVRREEVELKALLQGCILRMGHRLQNCAVSVAAGDTIKAYTDNVLLCRAVCLILDNAVKYGGKPPSIIIEFGAREGDGFISIRDNGIGIPEAQREAVFSKYTRLDRRDQQNAGTGLGLAIGAEIMRLLDGRITTANHPEGGAVFELQFPLGTLRTAT